MPLYSYKKAPIKYLPYRPTAEEKVIEIKLDTPKSVAKQGLTLWQILAGLGYYFNDLLIRSRVAGFLIPLFLVIAGAVIIYKEVWPDIEQKIKYATGYYDTSTVSLVAGDYIERKQYLSNPGAEYFEKLTTAAEDRHVLKDDPTSKNYSKNFRLSIPSLDLNNINVHANVDSGNEAVYDEKLNTGLAHFRGTGLPISEVENNIVIYGHSSSGDYYERTKDVAGAFSRLNRIKIGDEITLEMEGKTYKFVVTRSKIVNPEDISIVTGKGKRELTLFTCFPNGNSGKRFVAIARPVE